MLVINIGVLLVFGIGYIYWVKNPGELIKNADKQEHKLYFLYPIVDLLLTKTGLEKILNRKYHITDSIKALYITSKPELRQKLYWCNKISVIIAIFILFNMLSLLGQLGDISDSIVLDGKYVARPEHGEGSSEVELNVTMQQKGEGETADKLPVIQAQDLTIHIEERTYSEEELSVIFEEAIQFLTIDVLGNNESTERIYSNLKFSRTIPGTSISVDWDTEDYNLIQLDGTVNNEKVGPEGVRTTVTATLIYHEVQTRHCISFCIMPREYSEEERLWMKLEEEITTVAEKSEAESLLELPDTLEQYHLSWNEKEGNAGLNMFILGIFMAIVIWIYGDKELDKQMKKRKEQMILDYPEIINKFTLLVNAGMTVKQAWNKIAEDYSIKTIQKHSKKRYAYEEMLTTARELKLGLPEGSAYEQYGRRIGLIPYIKFSSLITQNLKKGNKGFTELLMREATEAFEERKEIAKRLGEEAGTKLLVPMMIMLIIVFLIILIPAFRSFGT